MRRGLATGSPAIFMRWPISRRQPWLEDLRVGQVAVYTVILVVILLLALNVCIVALDQGQRRINIQYSKRIVGRRVYGGQSTHIPMKVNQAGVIPVIFASIIISFPATILRFFDHPVTRKMASALAMDGNLYLVLYILLIIGFSYFYTAVQFDPFQVAGNIKKHGGFIPGLRPGRPTAEFLSKVISRLTTVGAFLWLPSPSSHRHRAGHRHELDVQRHRLDYRGGVILETMKQIESHMLMRSYRGFMK